MTDLRFGLVGCGMRGRLARVAHRPGSGSQVVAVLDPRPEAARRAQDWFGPEVRLADNLAQLAAMKLDAAFVLSPDHLHEEHAVSLLDAGIPIYLEKPMAISTAGCDRILATAKARSTRVFVGHNLRYSGFVRRLHELVAGGAIGVPKVAWCRHFVGHGGDFYFKTWHADRRNSNSLLLQKGAHDIDVLHWLCGSFTRTVTAMGELMVYGAVADRSQTPWHRDPEHAEEMLTTWPPSTLVSASSVIDVEDVSMMLMRLESGALASYQQCHFSPDYWRSYTVIGDEGRIENFGNGEAGTVVKLWNRRRLGYDGEPDRTYDVLAGDGDHGGADPLVLADFVHFLRSGGQTIASPLAARQAVAAGCAGAESLRSGSAPVDVPAVDPAVAAYMASGQLSGTQA